MNKKIVYADCMIFQLCVIGNHALATEPCIPARLITVRIVNISFRYDYSLMIYFCFLKLSTNYPKDRL